MLLTKNEIIVDGKKENNEDVTNQLYQKPNSSLFGYRLRLNIFNLASPNPDSIYKEKFIKNPKKYPKHPKIVKKNGQKFQKPGKISKNLKKITFFPQKKLNLKKKKMFKKEKEKNAILLVLPNEEISLRPELSSPAHFRIQGGSPERDGGVGVVVRVAGRYFPFLI